MISNKGGSRKKASNDEVLGIYGKLATLKEIKKNSVDRLKPLLRYTYEMGLKKPVKVWFTWVFFQYLFATILTIYHLLATFNTEELMKHGSFGGIQIFVLFNMGFLLNSGENLTLFFIKYGDAILPIEILDEKDSRKILLGVKIFKLIAIIDMALAILSALGFIAAPEDYDERMYLCVWISETFPDYSNFMLKVVHTSCIPVALSLAGCAIGWSYGPLTGIVQISILHEMISSISNSALPQKFRRDSKLYQECVKQKMIMSIMTHEYTARFQAMTSESIEITLLLLVSSSLILGGSLMLEFYGNQDRKVTTHLGTHVGIYCFTIAGVISTLSYFIIGQIVKDKSEECNHKLCELPWYDMNEENKKIYSIFLERSKKNMAISNSILQVDYNLLVRICKSLYSVATVMSRFTSSDE